MPRKISLFAFMTVALLGLAACGGDAENEVPAEEAPPLPTTLEEPVAPEAVKGTVQMDTTGAGAIVDTSSVPAATDTAAR